MERHRALVRRPTPNLADGIVGFAAREPVDVDLATRQWEGYVSALHDAGWQTIEVPPAPAHPDSVFVEDTCVVYGDTAVIARPGAQSRVGEPDAVVPVLVEAGYRTVRLSEGATLDGGDVLKFGGTVWVGTGGRTNELGVAELAAHLREYGVRVVSVPVHSVLHLKSAVTALPDGTVIGHGPLVDSPESFPVFREVPEEHGGHVVLLGGDELLMSTSAPRTTALLTEWGWRVRTVELTEFEKLDGCVTCLSVRLRG